MAELDNIMQQNLRQQRVPHLFATTKENEFSIKNLYHKMYNGEPAIFVDKDMLQGDSENMFNPHKTLTRAEAAELSFKLLKQLELNNLSNGSGDIK